MYGSRIGPNPQANSANTIRDKDTLLEIGELTTCSSIFYVLENPVRIAAFGLLGGARVKVKRLLLPTDTYKKDSCYQYVPPDTTLEKAFTICGQRVEITASVDELTIDAPGVYRLEYQGSGRADVKVVKILDKVHKVPNLDKGVCCNCSTHPTQTPEPANEG